MVVCVSGLSGDWQVRLDGTVDSTLRVRGQELAAGTDRLVFHLNLNIKLHHISVSDNRVTTGPKQSLSNGCQDA